MDLNKIEKRLLAIAYYGGFLYFASAFFAVLAIFLEPALPLQQASLVILALGMFVAFMRSKLLAYAKETLP